VSEPGSIDPVRADPGLYPLAGGKLLAEITNRIVLLVREHYGRGPIKAKTYVLDTWSSACSPTVASPRLSAR
jgi:hypothetical protein